MRLPLRIGPHAGAVQRLERVDEHSVHAAVTDDEREPEAHVSAAGECETVRVHARAYLSAGIEAVGILAEQGGVAGCLVCPDRDHLAALQPAAGAQRDVLERDPDETRVRGVEPKAVVDGPDQEDVVGEQRLVLGMLGSQVLRS